MMETASSTAASSAPDAAQGAPRDPATEAVLLLDYRMAAADLMRAGRDFFSAARHLDAAARSWAPSNTEEDAMVLACAESIEGMVRAAATFPGIRALLEAALGGPQGGAP